MAEPVTIISDLDDTVVPTGKAMHSYMEAMYGGLARASGLPRKDIVKAHTQMMLETSWVRFGEHLNAMNGLTEKFPGEDLQKKFAPEAKAAMEAYHAANKVDPDVRAFYEQAKADGHRLILFSAGSAELVADRLESAGITDLFDHVYCAPNKPIQGDIAATQARHPGVNWDKFTALDHRPKRGGDTRGLKHILQAEGIEARHAIMMGDNPVEDVTMAQNAGVKGALVTWYTDRHTETNIPTFAEMHAAMDELVGPKPTHAPKPKARPVAPDIAVAHPADLARRLTSRAEMPSAPRATLKAGA